MKRLLALVLFAAVAAGPTAVEAQGQGRAALGYGDRFHKVQNRLVPLSQVLRTIAARYPGRHLNTTTGEAGGRPAYFVQWQMENGRVTVFVVDAESGQIIGRQGG